jgi:hypothetical protein
MLETKGRSSHPVWIVGEYATYNDIKAGKVFSGGSHYAVTEQLEAAGINPDEVHFRYVCDRRPPKGNLDGWLCTKTQIDKKAYQPVGKGESFGIEPTVFEDIVNLRAAILQHGS